MEYGGSNHRNEELSMALTRSTLLLATVLWCALAWAFMAHAQTNTEVEKQIANLPPEQRAYERFRAWLNSLPPGQQRDDKAENRYRDYLKSKGLSDSDTD